MCWKDSLFWQTNKIFMTLRGVKIVCKSALSINRNAFQSWTYLPLKIIHDWWSVWIYNWKIWVAEISNVNHNNRSRLVFFFNDKSVILSLTWSALFRLMSQHLWNIVYGCVQCWVIYDINFFILQSACRNVFPLMPCDGMRRVINWLPVFIGCISNNGVIWILWLMRAKAVSKQREALKFPREWNSWRNQKSQIYWRFTTESLFYCYLNRHIKLDNC